MGPSRLCGATNRNCSWRTKSNESKLQKSKLLFCGSEWARRKLYKLILSESLQHFHPHQRIIRHLLLPCMISGWWIPSTLQKVPVKVVSGSVKFVHVALFSGNKSIDVSAAPSLCLSSEARSFVSCSGRSLVKATQHRRLSVGPTIFFNRLLLPLSDKWFSSIVICQKSEIWLNHNCRILWYYILILPPSGATMLRKVGATSSLYEVSTHVFL